MRKYTEEDYFNFLYDLAFTSEDYISLAKLLHNMDFEWVLRLDENRADDGIEIRKYYLADENGYLPDGIEVDDYIFPDEPSVLEVLVGFSNKICRDMAPKMCIPDLINMFVENLDIKYEDWEFPQIPKKIIDKIKKWELGEEKISIFGKKWGNGEKHPDLWSQASLWLYEIG